MEKETTTRVNADNDDRIKKCKLMELMTKQLDATDPAPLNIYEIRNYIYYGFSDDKLRPRYWKILLNYYPKNKFTTENYYKQSRKSYNSILEECKHSEQYKSNLEKIRSELKRNEFSDVQNNMFERILTVFTMINPGVGYAQGMEQLINVIYEVLKRDEDFENSKFIEEDVFCMFNNLISDLTDNFITNADGSQGIRYKIDEVFEILKKRDKILFKALQKKKLSDTMFPFRWILLLFACEYPIDKVIWLWDKLLSDSYKHELLLYCCAAATILMRDVIINEDFEKCMAVLQKPSIISPELLFDIADTMRRRDDDVIKIIETRKKNISK